jgi:tripartite-type tricarboxylate transporter receptor subunit TctC
VGVAPGGTTDIIARLIGQWLSERLGQRFIIENRPGAGFNIATEAVVKAPPDGYTLLFVVTSNAINTTLYERLNFVFLRDIAPVAGVSRSSFVWLVNPSFRANTIPELIDYAKANPNKLNIGGASPAQQVAIELFKMMAGVNMLYVPYRGDAPGLTDLMGGQVEMYLGGSAEAIEQVKAGRVRALAVTTATRLETLPGIPTVAESVPGYQASSFFGIGTPRSTPTEIIDTLNREINTGLANPGMQARFADLGAVPLALSAAAFGKFFAHETEKWGKVVKFAGIKAE